MVLKRDHQTISNLFNDFERIAEGETRARRDAFERVRAELEVHTKIEEELFYPELQKIDEVSDLVKEALAEHQLVKDLCAEIGRLAANDADYVAKVTVLRENVEHHVEEEESEIFPLAKKHLSSERLDKMGEQLENRRDELAKQLRKAEA